MIKWTIPVACAFVLAACAGTDARDPVGPTTGAPASSGASGAVTGPSATGTTGAGTDIGSAPAGGATTNPAARPDSSTSSPQSGTMSDTTSGSRSSGTAGSSGSTSYPSSSSPSSSSPSSSSPSSSSTTMSPSRKDLACAQRCLSEVWPRAKAGKPLGGLSLQPCPHRQTRRAGLHFSIMHRSFAPCARQAARTSRAVISSSSCSRCCLRGNPHA